MHQRQLSTPISIKKQPCSPIAFTESDCLFTKDMVTVSSSYLDEDCALYLSKHNEELIKRYNFKAFETEQRLAYKKSLECTLKEMKRRFEPEEIPENDVEVSCQYWEDKLAMAEIDKRVYESMVSNFKSHVYSVKHQVESIKAKLSKVESLYVKTGKTKQSMGKGKSGDDDLQTQMEDEKKARELQRKIEKGKKQHAAILQEIDSIHTRVEHRKDEAQYYEKRIKRIHQSIEKLKEKRLQYAVTVAKLKAYEEEFRKQYLSLTEKFGATKRADIMEKKESRDIQLQSERNDYSAKIRQLHFRSQILSKLRAQLAEFKVNTQKQIERLYDEGEYNPDSMSSAYVTNKWTISKIQKNLEEQLGFIRTVISGVKHILFKLHKSDNDNSTGSWYDLTVIAGIDEIDTTETRPKFSKLLMILEQKITSLCAILLQKVRHAELERSATEVPEDFGEGNAPRTEYIMQKGVIQCYLTLKRHVETKDLYLQLSSDEVPPLEKEISSNGYQRNRVVGSQIPLLVRQGTRFRRTFQSDEPDKRRSTQTIAKPKETSIQAEEDSFSTRNIDIMDVNRNVYDVMFSLKQRRSPPKESVQNLVVTKAEEEEQARLNERFKQGRTKIKFNKEMKRRAEHHRYCSLESLKKLKDKQKVTATTIEVAKALKGRPTEIVEVATTTFDALGKYKKALEAKQEKDLEVNHKLMPNFVNVVLHMKKARGDESIGKVAARCNYFPLSATQTFSSIPQSPTNGLITVATSPDSYMQSISSRLQNICSLNQLEKTQKRGYITAFDRYYGGAVKITPQTVKKPHNRTMTAVSMKTTLPLLGKGPLSVRPTSGNKGDTMHFPATVRSGVKVSKFDTGKGKAATVATKKQAKNSYLYQRKLIAQFYVHKQLHNYLCKQPQHQHYYLITNRYISIVRNMNYIHSLYQVTSNAISGHQPNTHFIWILCILPDQVLQYNKQSSQWAVCIRPISHIT
eukprot:TRINITY_DN3236_c0_g1_i2.p1 TRINITY_DN3236_c0_g1~~TRINITY_DN3236_c0_g1_i2.p1  ORF type:complete len:967 (+),score=72.39 TRINITY_DN3236_c0_g1_i2:1741-4641(+)